MHITHATTQNNLPLLQQTLRQLWMVNFLERLVWKKGISRLLMKFSSSEVHRNLVIYKIRKEPYLRKFLQNLVLFWEFYYCSASVLCISFNLNFLQPHYLVSLAYQREFPYTLYGSFGSDVSVILNVTFDLKNNQKNF